SLENFLHFIHPDDQDKLKADISGLFENNYLPFIYFRIIDKNGILKHFKAFGKEYKNAEGKKKVLGTISDITQEVEHFKILEERNLELERNNRELSAFNYVASHDLQEPLRKIQTFLSRLEDKESNNLSEVGILYMTRIKNAASRMRMLIDDLLQFSRTNKADKAYELANMNELLENAKQDLAELIAEENAIITSDTLPSIKIIPFQIQQLFSNLINNSIKYKAKNRTPKINITYSKVRSSEEPLLSNAKKPFYHKISVEDNGIGFSNEYAENIFILFN